MTRAVTAKSGPPIPTRSPAHGSVCGGRCCCDCSHPWGFDRHAATHSRCHRHNSKNRHHSKSSRISSDSSPNPYIDNLQRGAMVMRLEPAPRPPTLRRAAAGLVMIIALVATAGSLGWVSLVNLLNQVLAELLLLAFGAVVVALRHKSKQRGSSDGDDLRTEGRGKQRLGESNNEHFKKVRTDPGEENGEDLGHSNLRVTIDSPTASSNMPVDQRHGHCHRLQNDGRKAAPAAEQANF